jgi:hypothetical protein
VVGRNRPEMVGFMAGESHMSSYDLGKEKNAWYFHVFSIP